MTRKNSKVIAAFDFDGTITYSDSAIYFFLFIAGYLKTLLLLLKKLPVLTAFVVGRSSRQKTKESLFQAFFEGKTIENLKILGAIFAKEKIPQHIRPEALHRIRWHQKQGHRCILISASIDVYLEPWAKSMDFDDVLCSKLAVEPDGKISGKLEGFNCRGHEKVRRLQQLLGALDGYQIYVYGDSKGDKELLEISDYPFYRSMGS